MHCMVVSGVQIAPGSKAHLLLPGGGQAHLQLLEILEIASPVPPRALPNPGVSLLIRICITVKLVPYPFSFPV